jgi:SpoVK/Ycf46/Vps4 family AAA+-type ATPase
MATAEQIKALVASFAAEDQDRFRAVTMQIAALSAKQGKTKLAEELRALLDEATSRRNVHVGPAQPVPIARPGRDLAGLLTVDYPTTRAPDMVLAPELKGDLQRIIAEYRQRDRLRSNGLGPRRRLLLVGPPGCGKTMTARALAGECRLPLLSVQLHSLITKFMGETAAKLHLIFEAMQRTPGVYLFDEFDALGAGRDSPNDVGEIRRVLGSLLQFLEHHDSDGFVIAATNLRTMLDPALFRRFDAVLSYELPDPESVRPLIAQRLSMFDTEGLDWGCIATEAMGLSHADIVRAAEEAARDAVMTERETIEVSDLVRALRRRKVSPFPAAGLVN